MAKFVVLDTETRGLTVNSQVLSVSAVFIDMDTFTEQTTLEELMENPKHQCHWVLDRNEQTDIGLTYLPESREFWRNELACAKDDTEREIIKSLFKGETRIAQFTEEFTKWFNSLSDNPKEIVTFERGAGFDTTKITYLYDCLGKKVPYNYWKLRELRTWIICQIDDLDIAKEANWNYTFMDDIGIKDLVKHHSLHDAYRDAYCIAITSILGITKIK